MSCTSAKPSASGRSTMVSSKSTVPGDPGRLSGARGMTCFCPLSATAANQAPRFSRRRKASVSGFCPLLAFA